MLKCEGWWEQSWFGIQPMEELELTFGDGTVNGRGLDVIGPFTFDGNIVQGKVRMIKQYVGRHQVEYLGDYDGEGTMQGNWLVGGLTGRWAIRIRGASAHGAAREAARQIVPAR